MITNDQTTIDFEDLEAMYGTEKAELLFETYKQNHVPAIPITNQFAQQVVDQLPEGFAKVDPTGTQWRLYNPDSDSMLEWAECYRLVLPNGCHANIEVLDYTYYVDVEGEDGDVPACENVDGWAHIAPVIQELYDNIQARVL